MGKYITVKASVHTRCKTRRNRKTILLFSQMDFLIQAAIELHRQLWHYSTGKDEGTPEITALT